MEDKNNSILVQVGQEELGLTSMILKAFPTKTILLFYYMLAVTVVAEKLCKLDLKMTADVEPLVLLYLFSSFFELIDLLDVF